MPIAVMMVDHHQLVREALRDALARQPDIDIVGEAGDAATALERVRTLAPDVVVLDSDTLPDISGPEAVARLKGCGRSGLGIVALSAATDQDVVTGLLRAGVSGYVTKLCPAMELIEAVRAVAAGRTHLCSEVASAVASVVRNGEANRSKLPITEREREVLCLIAQGIRSPAIGERLGISLGTVEVHRRNMLKKLRVRSVAELTRYAIRHKLIGC